MRSNRSIERTSTATNPMITQTGYDQNTNESSLFGSQLQRLEDQWEFKTQYLARHYSSEIIDDCENLQKLILQKLKRIKNAQKLMRAQGLIRIEEVPMISSLSRPGQQQQEIMRARSMLAFQSPNSSNPLYRNLNVNQTDPFLGRLFKLENALFQHRECISIMTRAIKLDSKKLYKLNKDELYWSVRFYLFLQIEGYLQTRVSKNIELLFVPLLDQISSNPYQQNYVSNKITQEQKRSMWDKFQLFIQKERTLQGFYFEAWLKCYQKKFNLCVQLKDYSSDDFHELAINLLEKRRENCRNFVCTLFLAKAKRFGSCDHTKLANYLKQKKLITEEECGIAEKITQTMTKIE